MNKDKDGNILESFYLIPKYGADIDLKIQEEMEKVETEFKRRYIETVIRHNPSKSCWPTGDIRDITYASRFVLSKIWTPERFIRFYKDLTEKYKNLVPKIDLKNGCICGSNHLDIYYHPEWCDKHD